VVKERKKLSKEDLKMHFEYKKSMSEEFIKEF